MKDRSAAYLAAIKAQEKYEARCKEAESLAQCRQNYSGKELEKHDGKVKKASVLAQESEKDYRLLVARAQEAYERWQTIMKAGCDKLQETEEARLNQIKAVMMNYSNIIAHCSGLDLNVFKYLILVD